MLANYTQAERIDLRDSSWFPTEQHYQLVRHATLRLTEPLAVEDQVGQPIPEASPTKWHLAHTTWFFERFCLREHARGYESPDDRYDYLFNSYCHTAGEMHPRARRGRISQIGAAGDTFCFDNEMPRHRVLVGDHALAIALRASGSPTAGRSSPSSVGIARFAALRPSAPGSTRAACSASTTSRRSERSYASRPASHSATLRT